MLKIHDPIYLVGYKYFNLLIFNYLFKVIYIFKIGIH